MTREKVSKMSTMTNQAKETRRMMIILLMIMMLNEQVKPIMMSDARKAYLTARSSSRSNRGEVITIDGVIGGGGAHHQQQQPSIQHTSEPTSTTKASSDPEIPGWQQNLSKRKNYHLISAAKSMPAVPIQEKQRLSNQELNPTSDSLVDQFIDHDRNTSQPTPTLTITNSNSSTFCPNNNNSNNNNNNNVSNFLTGYIHLDNHLSNGSLFFWFVQARNEPDRAPLILWLNGGPGSSSMLGMFQENGPCRIKSDSSGLDSNPESWNENAHLIYIDQPIATGYSYGKRSVNTTARAVIDLYDAIQGLLSDSHFKQFVGRPFGVWTESYGGHFAPVLVDYILDMNLKISSQTNHPPGRVIIPINSLGIGNGLVNPLVQYPSYISYAKSNPYNQTLVSNDVIETANNDFIRTSTGCRDLIKTCQSNLRKLDCKNAQQFCNSRLLTTLIGNRDVYDVRHLDPNPYPANLAPVLNEPKFKTSIGVPLSVNWTESNEALYLDFFSTGDWMLDSSPQLERVINSGVRTLLYAGDADFIVNYQGVEDLVNSLKIKVSNSINSQTLSNWIIDGELAGVFKSSDSFSYLRVLEAGHEVPAYGKGKLGIGRAAKIFFDQTISNQSIASINTSNANNLNLTSNRTKTNDSNSANDPYHTRTYLKSSFLPFFVSLLLLLPYF